MFIGLIPIFSLCLFFTTAHSTLVDRLTAQPPDQLDITFDGLGKGLRGLALHGSDHFPNVGLYNDAATDTMVIAKNIRFVKFSGASADPVLPRLTYNLVQPDQIRGELILDAIEVQSVFKRIRDNSKVLKKTERFQVTTGWTGARAMFSVRLVPVGNDRMALVADSFQCRTAFNELMPRVEFREGKEDANIKETISHKFPLAIGGGICNVIKANVIDEFVRTYVLE